MAYSRILVAVDLTEESTEVLSAASSKIELQSNSDIHIVTVIKPLNYGVGGLDGSGLTVVAEIQDQMRQSAISAGKRWAAELNIPESSVHVRTGQPAAEIKATAEEIQADLIVIGTHGRHGLGLLLGSTANGVLHGVKCDVLTVRIH